MARTGGCETHLSVVWGCEDEAQGKGLLRCAVVPVPHVLHSTALISICCCGLQVGLPCDLRMHHKLASLTAIQGSVTSCKKAAHILADEVRYQIS